MPILEKKYYGEELNVKFIHDPLIEMVCSLHVMSDMSHHSDCAFLTAPIVDAMQPELASELAFFSDHAYQWLFIMDLFSEIVASDSYSPNADPVENLQKLTEHNNDDFAYLYLGTTLNTLEEIRAWICEPKRLEQEENLPLFQYIDKSDVYYFITHVDTVKLQLTHALIQYWNQHFSSLWDHLKRCSQNEIASCKQKMSMQSIFHLLSERDGIVISGNTIHIPRYPHLNVSLTDISELTVLFSAFTKAHTLLHIHKPYFFVYQYIPVPVAYNQQEVPSALPEIFHVLGDKTRLNILLIIKDQGKSTKDLTEILNLSPSTVSKHLSILKGAELVECTKGKKFTYYKAQKAKFRELAEAIQIFY